MNTAVTATQPFEIYLDMDGVYVAQTLAPPQKRYLAATPQEAEDGLLELLGQPNESPTTAHWSWTLIIGGGEA